MTPVLFTRYYMKRVQGLEEILKNFTNDFYKALSGETLENPHRGSLLQVPS